MMPPTIFSITITHPPCREGRVNHRPHPQLRRIKCQIYHIWYIYLMFDRPSPPLRRINYQIYYIWCRYLIFDRPSPWLWRMPTRNLLFAFSSLSLPSWSDQCFFMSEKSLTPMSSHEEPIVEICLFESMDFCVLHLFFLTAVFVSSKFPQE